MTDDDGSDGTSAIERALARLRPAAPSRRVELALEQAIEGPVGQIGPAQSGWRDGMLIAAIVSGAIAACVSVTLLLTDPAAVTPPPQALQARMGQGESAVMAARVYLAHFESGAAGDGWSRAPADARRPATVSAPGTTRSRRE